MATVHSGGVLPSGPLSKVTTLPAAAVKPKASSQLKVLIRNHCAEALYSHSPYDSVVAHYVVRRRPHHVLTSVAETITAPPARAQEVGRSAYASQVQTGLMAGSSWSMVVASKAGT